MPVKHSNNFMRCIILPLAVCAMMFSARCSDDGSEELTQQALLSLVSCKGGTMSFTIDGAPRTWTCCTAFKISGTYWVITGSNGNELLQLKISNEIAATYNDSTIASHEYIEYGTLGDVWKGVTDAHYTSGSSSTIVTSSPNAVNIEGTFSGDLYYYDGVKSNRVIAGGTFTALK